MIKAVIFDMDGLMIDSEPIQSKAFEAVIREQGKEPIFKENGLVHQMGIRGDDSWRLIKEEHAIEEEIQILRERRREIYLELLKGNLHPMPGLFELLKFLKKKKIKMAIASSSPRNHIELIIESLDIKDYFSYIVSGDDVTKGKPDPEAFLKAAQGLRVLPKDCLVLEDAENGVIAGKNAGMKVIVVANKYTKNHNFEKADRVVASLHDIMSAF